MKKFYDYCGFGDDSLFDVVFPEDMPASVSETLPVFVKSVLVDGNTAEMVLSVHYRVCESVGFGSNRKQVIPFTESQGMILGSFSSPVVIKELARDGSVCGYVKLHNPTITLSEKDDEKCDIILGISFSECTEEPTKFGIQNTGIL